jgi:DNA invertase Pin-like site-specific DNA recombinase
LKVAGYVRKSTDDPEKQVYTVESQMATIRAVCKEKGLELAGVGYLYGREQETNAWKGRPTTDGFYVDTGISGTVFDRPALQALRKDVKSKSLFELVLMVNFDRIARDNADSSLVRKEFAGRGVRVAETSAPDMDSGSTTGKLVYGIKGVVAEFEHDMISERTKRAMAMAKSKGKALGRPAWGSRSTQRGTSSPTR